jgi:two-component system OmpR family response regulator
MPKALIVEDNLRFSETLRGALQAQFPSLRLAQAASVREALCSIESMQPDLIISDLGLPDGSGLGLTRSIRAAGIQSAIIILTSHDLPEYREAALSSGADHFMTKGAVSITDIFSVIRSILPCKLSGGPSSGYLPI